MRTAFLAFCLLLFSSFLATAQESAIKGDRMTAAVDISEIKWESHGDGTNTGLGRQILSVTEVVVNYISSGNWNKLYTMSSSEYRQTVSLYDYVSNSRGFKNDYGRIIGHELIEIFVIDIEELSEAYGAFQTGPIRSKYLPSSVIFSIPYAGRLAFIVSKVEVTKIDSTLWLALGFKEEEGKWSLFAFDARPAVLYGMDGDWYRERAKNFALDGQLRNAFFYRAIAHALLTIGGFVDTVAAREVEKSMNESVPENVPTPGIRPAENWPISEHLTVSVHYVGIVMTREGLGVEVRYSTGHSDLTSEEAKTERYLVYKYIRQSFPEFEDAFGAVYVGSVNHSGDGFRDVFLFDNADPK